MTPSRALAHMLALALLPVLVGCAGGVAQPLRGSAGATPATGGAAASRYVPTAAEEAYDCRRLTGLIQVRLLQLRSPDTASAQSTVTAAARAVRASLEDGGAVWREERARLEAYNGLLARKGCPTFDIAAELDGTHDSQRTPRPHTAHR